MTRGNPSQVLQQTIHLSSIIEVLLPTMLKYFIYYYLSFPCRNYLNINYPDTNNEGNILGNNQIVIDENCLYYDMVDYFTINTQKKLYIVKTC